jgi:hypothetical protein
MTKKRTSNQKRTRKSVVTSIKKNDDAENAAYAIAKWWRGLKMGM